MFTIIKDTDSITPIKFATTTGEAVDLTKATVYFTIKMKLTATDADAIYATNITTHLEPEAGLTRLTIPRSATKNFPAGKYYFDFKIKSQGIISGTIPTTLKIVESVTRREDYG
jgi:hypothetical protein